jgi:hypothetical protein
MTSNVAEPPGQALPSETIYGRTRCVVGVALLESAPTVRVQRSAIRGRRDAHGYVEPGQYRLERTGRPGTLL